MFCRYALANLAIGFWCLSLSISIVGSRFVLTFHTGDGDFLSVYPPLVNL